MSRGTHSCFECGGRAGHAHHVVPRSLGGSRTIPLCPPCHGKVHGVERVSTSTLILAGLARARARGVKLGRPAKLGKRKMERLLLLRRQGFSIRELAKLFGVAKSTVQEALATKKR